MLFFLFSATMSSKRLFERLGYPYPDDTRARATSTTTTNARRTGRR